MVGALTENLNEAEQLLMARNDNIYRRGDLVVMSAPVELVLSGGEVIKQPGIIAVTPLRMREIFTRAIDFQTFSNEGGEFRPVDCPHDFARTYLDRKRGWRLPYLRTVVTTPFLRPDFSLVQQPGYDAESGILFDPQGVEFPPVPEKPSWDDALAALDCFDKMFGDFPFVLDGPANGESEPYRDQRGKVHSASRSVAYSILLSGLARTFLKTCPLHGVNARQARTGKTKLVDCASIIVCGHPTPPIGQGRTRRSSKNGSPAN
jgi:putative DNA primase/helicase